MIQPILRLASALVLAGLLAAPAAPSAAQSAPILIRLESGAFDPLDSQSAQDDPGGSAWLVQFVGPVHESWKQAVRSAGADLAFYLPDHTFLTRMDASAAERVRSLPNVRWVGPYRTAFRLSAAADGALDAQGHATYAVQTFSGIDLGRLEAAIHALGGTLVGAADNGFAGYLRVLIAPSQRRALGALDGVVWVEPYEAAEALNDRAVPVLRVPQVRQDLGLYGAGQTVAVADSGLDSGNLATIHPDFAKRVVKTYCLARPDPCNWGDDNGHGTHVAGSVLGSGVTTGADPARRRFDGSNAGAAPEASLIVQAIGGPGTSMYVPVDAGDLLRLAVRDGAFVQTNSWGGGSDGGYRLTSQQFDYATWQERAGLALVAAGNSGVDRDRSGRIDPTSLGSPGTAKNVLTVGASENNRPDVTRTYGQLDSFSWPAPPIRDDPVANRIDGIAAFSSRGPTIDGRLKPDVVAPGTEIDSAFSRISPMRGATSTTAIKTSSGTSMATPLVAGTAALVREWLQSRRQIHTPSSALLKALLLNGAEDIAPGQYGTSPALVEIPAVRPNPVSGLGRVNLQASIAPTGTRQIWIAEENNGLRTGERATYSLTTSGAGPLRFTLVWNDFPGQPGAASLLVNDLDLEVVGPGGTLVGNAGAYPAGDRCLRGVADRCNTVETVILSAAPAGSYQIRVSGSSVPQGERQPFAVVASGEGVGAGPGQNVPPTAPVPAAGGRSCPDSAASGVYLYALPGFQGACSFFTADAPFADGWHIGNDQAQSLRIIGALTAIVWTDSAYQGRPTSFSGPLAIANLADYPCGAGCLGPKEASSIQVRYQGAPLTPPPPSGLNTHLPHGLLIPGNCDGNAGIYLYTEPNFGGRCARIMLGDPDWFTSNANTWFVGNDAVQSLRFLPRGRQLDDGRFDPSMGFRATLYEDVGYGGRWTQISATLLEIATLATPPAGYSGPWIGAKTLSSLRLEIVQLPEVGVVETDYLGGGRHTAWLPVVEG